MRRAVLLMALVLAGCKRDPPVDPCPKGLDPRCSEDGRTLTTCRYGRDSPRECDRGQACERGACRPVVCTGGLSFCDGQIADRCSALGTEEVREECAAMGQVCVQDAGGARCVKLLCTPGRVDCSLDGRDVVKCQPDGMSQELVQRCSDPQQRGNACVNGVCADRCALLAGKPRTTVGCSFVGAPLAPGQARQVLIENLQDDLPASVTVSDGSGKTVKQVIPAGGGGAIAWGSSPPDGTFEGPWGWLVESTVPVLAWQIGDGSDGTLLVPEGSLGKVHQLVVDGAMGEERLAVVGTQAATSVKVTPTVTTRAGGGVPSLPAGMESARTIGRGDLLVLAAAGPGLAGTRIEASAPVAVFAIVEGAHHGEEAVLPWAMLGKRHFAGMGAKVMGREDGTKVTTSGGSFPIDAGQVIALNGEGEVVADKPVAIFGSAKEAQSNSVPYEQWVVDPVVVAPSGGFYALVTARDRLFELDGVMHQGDKRGTLWTKSIGPLAAGRHRVTGTIAAIHVTNPMSDGASLTGVHGLETINP